MIYLLLSILCSTGIVFIFKFFPKFQIHTFQAIVVNYLFCVLTAWFTLGEFPIAQDVHEQFWFPQALIMGFLFITGFNLFALTVQKFGVTVGAVMQKMSILLSVSWTILMYNEPMSTLKFVGILAAMAAIVLTSLPPEQEASNRAAIPKWMYIFPAYVLLSSGLIEIILFEVEQKSATSGDLNFIATLFGTAFVLGVCVLIFGLLTQKFRWHWNNFFAGAILGVINFGSIYYLMKSIGFGWDGSVVFPINNVAIIGLSVLIAYFALSEKLSKLNWLGVFFAGLSILLITIG